MKTSKKTEFVPAKPHVRLTTGEVIRMLRELKGWTQAELAKRCGISATNISLLENNRAEYRDWETDRKSTRLNSSHSAKSRMPSSA